MNPFLLVFLGGGLGSLLRYLIGKQLNPVHLMSFPWGTFIVNLLGSLIIGGFFAWLLTREKPLDSLLLFLVVGFCGGFTTFSAFTHESLLLLRHGQTSLFLTYILASLILGILFVWLGYVIISKLI